MSCRFLFDFSFLILISAAANASVCSLSACFLALCFCKLCNTVVRHSTQVSPNNPGTSLNLSLAVAARPPYTVCLNMRDVTLSSDGLVKVLSVHSSSILLVNSSTVSSDFV